MLLSKRTAVASALVAIMAGPATLPAQAFNSGLIGSCVGNCGTSAANGAVTLSGLDGSTRYGWVSSLAGVGAITSGVGFSLGGESTGSMLTYSFSTLQANTSMSFRFQYISTDDRPGSRDYGYARVRDVTNSVSYTLLAARTNPTVGGQMVPAVGAGLGPTVATLSPPTASPVLGGAQTVWSPLGTSSGVCFGAGCGRTDWIRAEFTLTAAANYQVEFGVVNWNDYDYDSGLAFDFNLGTGGVPNAVPEPRTVSLVLAGLVGVAAASHRRRRSA